MLGGMVMGEGATFVVASNYAQAEEAARRERIEPWTYVAEAMILRRARKGARVLLVDGWPTRGDVADIRRALDAVRAYTRRVEIKG